MIDRILDKYYARKVLLKLEDCLWAYYVDKKIKIKNGYGYLYVKDVKECKHSYKLVFKFEIKQSLLHLIKIDECNEVLQENMKNKSKKEFENNSLFRASI